MSVSKECPVAVVTGATGGIGERISIRLLENGYSVCAIGRDVDKLKSCKEQLDFAAGAWQAFSAPPHPKSWYYPWSAWGNIKTFRSFLEQLPRIDLLVCAHGASASPAVFECITYDDYRAVHDTDVWYTIETCQEVLPYMVRQKSGSVTILSSFHVRGTYPFRTVYNTAKHAVVGLTESLCVEYAKYGIKVN
jgi:NAD(P)-dependent dehydrogenase (short-subunit alcohol dehydrogenase family)